MVTIKIEVHRFLRQIRTATINPEGLVRTIFRAYIANEMG